MLGKGKITHGLFVSLAHTHTRLYAQLVYGLKRGCAPPYFS